MTITEILQSEILNLPVIRDTSEFDISYPHFVHDKLKKYKDLILQLENFHIAEYNNYFGLRYNDLIKQLVTNLNITIYYAILDYYKGNPIEAYKEIDKILSLKKNPIKNIKGYLFTSHITSASKLYRLREKEEGKIFKKKDLFHVPYELREKIATKRYSISGFPSLYLSDSIYTASKELQINSLDDVFASRFELNENERFHLLDLTNKTNYFRRIHIKEKRPIDGATMKFLVSWPLIMVSSIKVNKIKEPFIPEYIIPQLILLWIRNNTPILDGIKYSSSHISLANNNNNGGFYNVVIPCRDILPNGYCSYLKSKFKLTEPFKNDNVEVDTKWTDFQTLTIDSNGILEDYYSTSFARLEKRLMISDSEKI